MNIKTIANNPKVSKEFYIYAETAFIHEGDKNYLKKLIDEAKKAKCDGIKFQILLDKDSAYAPSADVYRKIDKWCFGKKIWMRFIKYAKSKNLEVIVLPVDLKSLDFCKQNANYIDAIEIHPVNFNDYFMLKKLERIGKIPIFLGTGGRTIKEVSSFLKMLKANSKLILMHGFQSFPTKIKDINLAKIKKYKEIYNLPVGYADHTKFNDDYGNNLIEYAFLLGAVIFEKHITLKKGSRRTDYQSAVEYQDILRLRQGLEKLMTAIGKSKNSQLSRAEAQYRNREKKLVYAKDIKAGKVISYDCIGFKIVTGRSDYNIEDINKIVGARTKRNLKKNTTIKFKDIILK